MYTVKMYNVNSYVAYNKMGSLSSGIDVNGDSIDRPKGVVAAGQSFFINANATGVATFKNSMRVGSQNQENSQFYRTSGPVANAFASCDPSPPSRLWLNLRNLSSAPQGFKQTMVGYSPNATTSATIDRGYDSVTNNTTFDIEHNIYSVSPGNAKLTIQGHYTTGASIDITDVFPLGISYKKNTLATNRIQISVSQFDGLFTTTPFYLRKTLDDGTREYYDIRTTPYEFDITESILDNTSRFAIVYQQLSPKMVSTTSSGFTAAATPNPYSTGFTVAITTTLQGTVHVLLYDVLGKLVETATVPVAELEGHTFGSNVSAGFYTAVVMQGDKKEVIKIIKK